jgi:hypothetical protein
MHLASFYRTKLLAWQHCNFDAKCASTPMVAVLVLGNKRMVGNMLALSALVDYRSLGDLFLIAT